MRCPRCHASNPETATFCGQCYERFVPAPGAPLTADPLRGAVDAQTPGPQAAGTQAADTQTSGPQAAETQPGAAVAVGRFEASDGGLTWRCGICDSTHPVGVFTCGVCGAKMDAEVREGTGPVDLEQAKRLEAMAPGRGHLRSGHTGMGAARSGIVLVWLALSLVLASGGLVGLLTALPLVVGLVAIWVTGPGDLAAVAAGRAPRLDARRFMYLVIGATTGVIVAGGLAVIL